MKFEYLYKKQDGMWVRRWKVGEEPDEIKAEDRISFDPESVKIDTAWRWNQLSPSASFVSVDDYRALLALLHDVSSEADPAGTLRDLRLDQDIIRATEKLVEALIVKIKAIKGAVNDEKPHDALRPLLDELLKGAYRVLWLKGEGQ